MTRINDVGGLQGFPPVQRDEDELPFHADWEAHVFALNNALRRRDIYSTDEFRNAIELMGAQQYLAASYYERWLHAMLTLLGEKGILDTAELASVQAAGEHAGD